MQDKSKVFNTARVEALELDNMLEVALASAICAERRTESRGGHSRVDYPERDDKQWLAHSVYFMDGRLAQRKVNQQPHEIDPIALKERDH